MTSRKMKVEIWSDITCPFCYMGKRNFENGLSQFKENEHVEIIWKSFELAPDLKTQPDKNINMFLAELKGISLEQSMEMGDHVAGMANRLGLVYNFDKTIPANSFNAHRLLHLAKKYDLSDKAKEVLFRAYFTDGRNIDDMQTLSELGREIGLDTNEMENFINSDLYSKEVLNDIQEARNAGVTGVPFYLFNSNVGVRGAQSSDIFLNILEKSFQEWKTDTGTTDDELACKIGDGCLL